MRDPSKNSFYFTRRKLKKVPDYEEAYWGTVIDPDGNLRVRSQEREKYLQNVRTELEFVNSLPPGRILDIGCGMGFFLSAVDGRWEKHGVEISNYASQFAREWGTVHTGTLESAHYPDGFFDAIVMYHLIEHLPDPVAAIREIRRILKGGGALILGTPDFDSACARRFGANYRLLHDPTHVSLFTNRSMHALLADYGFDVDHVDYPFFDTAYFTRENLMRLFDTAKVSPPFYGNFMTFYCRKPDAGFLYDWLIRLRRLISRAAESLSGKSPSQNHFHPSQEVTHVECC